MSLKEQLQKDLIDALKSGDQLKRLVLGMVSSAIKQKELQNRAQLSKTVTDPEELQKKSQLDDTQSLEVIISEVKKRRESVEQFKAGGRNELADKEEREIKILIGYLPEQVNESVVRDEVLKTISELNVSDIKEMGKVMAAVMSKLRGKADGSVVSRIVKEELSNK